MKDIRKDRQIVCVGGGGGRPVNHDSDISTKDDGDKANKSEAASTHVV